VTAPSKRPAAYAGHRNPRGGWGWRDVDVAFGAKPDPALEVSHARWDLYVTGKLSPWGVHTSTR